MRVLERWGVVLSVAAVVLSVGCARLGTGRGLLSRRADVPAPLDFTYPAQEGVEVRIVFENERAYDAVQLGLYLLAQIEKREETLRVENKDFFPKYLAVVNTDIADGLLRISEREAKAFARSTYVGYQQMVRETGLLPELAETRVLTDIVGE